jgi:1-pyrroline-5-carboxylate dehydrogenase
MGNKVLVNVDTRVAIVAEKFIRLLICCGAPKTDILLMHTDKEHMRKFIKMSPGIKLTQFIGKIEEAEEYVALTKGRCKILYPGVNWKILGQGALSSPSLDYIAY